MGVIWGSLWDHSGIILGSIWDHFGINLGSFWNDFGMILGWFWDPPLECDSSARGAPPRRVFNACVRWAPPPRKKAVGRGAAPGGDYYEMQSRHPTPQAENPEKIT